MRMPPRMQSEGLSGINDGMSVRLLHNGEVCRRLSRGAAMSDEKDRMKPEQAEVDDPAEDPRPGAALALARPWLPGAIVRALSALLAFAVLLASLG